MKKIYTNPFNYILVFLLFLITSCTDKNHNSKSDNNVKTASIAIDTTPNGNQQTNTFSTFPNFDQTINNAKKYKEQQIGEYLREVFEDSNGNMWFGTLAKGVARYDGKSLIYLTTEDGLADNQVNHIVEDKKGNLWFATTNGISSYDGKSFTSYRTTEGLKHNSTWSLLIDKNENIWIGTVGGLSRFDGKSFSDFPLPETKSTYSRFSPDLVWDMIEDVDGNIWFGTDGIGVYKYNPLAEQNGGEIFTHFTEEDGLCNDNIISILEDKKGNMWFGSNVRRVSEPGKPYSFVDSDDAGLARYDGQSFKRFPEVKGLKGKSVGEIYEDKKGNIWVASMHYGVYRYNGKSFTLFDEKQGFTNNCVQSIFEDSNGNMWFGFSGGLFLWNGMKFRNIRKDGPWF